MRPWNRKACQLRIARDTAALEAHNRAAIANFDSATRVMQTICKVYCLTLNQLQSRRRQRKICWPRQLAIYFIKHRTGYSQEQIAALFRLGPNTVSWAIKAVTDALETSCPISREIAALAGAIGNTKVSESPRKP